jgi:hypothetical protein
MEVFLELRDCWIARAEIGGKGTKDGDSSPESDAEEVVAANEMLLSIRGTRRVRIVSADARRGSSCTAQVCKRRWMERFVGCERKIWCAPSGFGVWSEAEGCRQSAVMRRKGRIEAFFEFEFELMHPGNEDLAEEANQR